MTFKWTKKGIKKQGNQFSSPKPVLFTYEIETDAKTYETSRISRVEMETICIVESGVTWVYTSNPSITHKLLKEIAEGDRVGWNIEELGVDKDGSPITVKMTFNGDKLTIRK